MTKNRLNDANTFGAAIIADNRTILEEFTFTAFVFDRSL